MLEETVFINNEEIIKFVKDVYDLDITNVDRINRGSANIYSLNNDSYVLKEFQSDYSEIEIINEIDIINHLKKDNISVPTYIKTKNNEFYCLYKERIIILQEFIDGYTLHNNEGDLKQTLECAELYGCIIKSLETLDRELPTFDISEWYTESALNEAILKHEKLISLLDDRDSNYSKIKSDLEEKISMIESIKDKDFSNYSKLTIKNTHGDYSQIQFIYKDDKVNAVIDFVSACKMPIVWEIIRSYSYIDSDAKNGEFNLDHLVEYVKTVNKHVPLNKYDIEYMPYVYLLQLLNSTYGYKQYINDPRKIELLEFGYFRTNICKYLFKNADLISEKLLNCINVKSR